MIKSLKDSSLMFISNLLTGVFTFLVGIFIRNILGPHDYGVWLSVSLIIIYGSISQLGVINGMNREIPRLLGANEVDKAQYVRSVSLSWMVVPFVISLTSIGILLFLSFDWYIKFLAAFALLLVPIQQVMNYYRMLYLTVENYRQVALNQMIIGPMQQLLSLLFSVLFGVSGLFIAILISSLISIVIFIKSLNYKIVLKWDIHQIRYLMTFGVPIMVIGLSWSLFTSVDRIMISYYLGPNELGLYGIAILVFQTLMLFPQVFSQIIYPKISFAYGKNGNSSELKYLLDNSVIIFAYFIPYLLGLIYYMFPLFVKWFMPEYTEGLLSTNILVFGIFFLTVIGTYANYLNSANKHYVYLGILLSSITINVFINFITINYGFNIEGVAVSTSISNFIYATLIIYSAYKVLHHSNSDFFKQITRLYSPFVLMITLIFILEYIISSAFFQIILYIILYTLFLAIQRKRIEPLYVLKNILSKNRENIRKTE